MSAHVPAGHPLLVVIDPVARAIDGESVRIAKDVLCAGAVSVKIVFPESAEETERALAHRGRRHPVVLGDDAALLRTVSALRREQTLHDAPVSVVPIGPRSTLARALGVPEQVPAAARAVLDGVERELDLLVDESGGIVLGTLSIPCGTPVAHTAARWWTPVEKTARSLVRTLTSPVPVNGQPAAAPSAAAGRGGRRAAGRPRRAGARGVGTHRARPARAEVFVRHTDGATQVQRPRPLRSPSPGGTSATARTRRSPARCGPVRGRWSRRPGGSRCRNSPQRRVRTHSGLTR